jgi:hypothetical protein
MGFASLYPSYASAKKIAASLKRSAPLLSFAEATMTIKSGRALTLP